MSLLSKLSFLSLNESALRTKFGIVEGRQDSIPCLASEEGISEEESRLGLDRIVRCNSHFIASIS